MMSKFESYYKDDYTKLIDGLTEGISKLSKKNKPQLHEEKTFIPETLFLTEIDNDNYDTIHEVNPKVRTDDWQYTVVQK